MHYKIKGICIQSEYAAKSVKQQSRAILDWINNQEKVINALDYGCGKLRYSKELNKICKNLYLLDSKVQLERIQLLFDEKLSIVDYVRNCLPHAKIVAVEDYPKIKVKFDIVLCINVLSSIPTWNNRNVVIKNIASLLKNRGKALFVTQYYDTFFTKSLKDPSNIKFNDGWISKGNTNSFYGLIGPIELEEAIIKNKLHIINKWKASKSVFIEASKSI